MSNQPSTESPAFASRREATTDSPSGSRASAEHVETEPKSWILRPRVRRTIYALLALFLLGLLAWGIVPRILDPTFEQHIQDKQVMVGMTREQVLQAWGSPYQTNISHTSDGIRREEWIFEEWKSSSDIKHRYLYFEEGILVGGWK